MGAGGRAWRILALCLLLPVCARSATYSDFLTDTLAGMERLRGANGLPRDTVLIAKDGSLRPPRDIAEYTSPSNIAIDLLVQLDLLDRPSYRSRAQEIIDRELTTLSQEPTQPGSGLFYSWYLTNGLTIAQRDISSIDNLHLALALWAIAKRLPDTITGRAAAKLFDKMDFAGFVDSARGVLGGNLHFVSEDHWTLDEFRYDYFGSETRSLYSVGAAIDIRGVTRAFLETAVAKLTVEMAAPYKQRILRTWDGGTFQLFLPEVLIAEHRYSTELAASFRAYADFAWREGERRALPLPATHSACVIAIDPLTDDPHVDDTRVLYQGQEGSKAVGNRQATQVFDDSTVASHAVLLAATADPGRYLAALEKTVQQLAAAPVPFYRPQLGFVDGLRMSSYFTPPTSHAIEGVQALPVALALDKGLEALALLQILANDGMTASARALHSDAGARAELIRFYSLVDKKLSAATIVD